MIGWWLHPLAGGGSTHDLTRPLPDDRTETSRRVGHPPEKIMIPLRSCKSTPYRVEYEDRFPSETAGVWVGCVRRLKRWLRCATCNRWLVFTRPGARMKRKENDCKFHAGGFQATLSRANSGARLGRLLVPPRSYLSDPFQPRRQSSASEVGCSSEFKDECWKCAPVLCRGPILHACTQSTVFTAFTGEKEPWQEPTAASSLT